MVLPFIAAAVALALLLWSSNRFVEGSAAVARRLRVPSLLVGMVVVGFGTSAPEMAVSAIAAWQANAGVALGNAYGSNIANIALILGLTALIRPVAVNSSVLRMELPILTAATLLAAVQLYDGFVGRNDAIILLAAFGLLVWWTVLQGFRKGGDVLADQVEDELEKLALPLPRAVLYMAGGLAILIVSSRALVWAAVEIAGYVGIPDVVIGLTVVAVGTSLPELASSIAAIRKGENDIALGNILGSNLFNTLAVVGIAGVIRPLHAAPELFRRDIPLMTALTIALFIIGYGFSRPGRINRIEGAILLAVYIVYTTVLFSFGR